TNREAWAENHLGDRDSLDLLGAQHELVKEVVETGTPTIVLLINGRPLSINYISEHVPAILEGWYWGRKVELPRPMLFLATSIPEGNYRLPFLVLSATCPIITTTNLQLTAVMLSAR